MSSINTNSSAMTALKMLNTTEKALERTQEAISTGYRVNTARDNAAYWSIATAMRSDNKSLSTVLDALGLGAAKVDTTYTAINAAIDVVDEIKAKLVAAREPSIDRTKIQTEIEELQSSLSSIAESAAFNGENWLDIDSSATGYSANANIVASFKRASDGTVAVATITLSKASVALFDANAAASGILDSDFDLASDDGASPPVTYTASVSTLDLTAAYVTDADIDAMITGVEAALQSLTGAASDMGSAQKRVDMQVDFVGNLMDAIERGVGQLVDADMSEESTRLQALQVQQQLGIQALSIANASSQNILALFQ